MMHVKLLFVLWIFGIDFWPLQHTLRGCLSDIASSYFLRPSKVTEHVTSRVIGGEFKTK